MLKTLNPKQYEAVTTTDGAVLVLAGAGSGKTKVITSRIAHLIKNKGVHPKSILAVTFTNKAAKEMAERVRSLVSLPQHELQVSTFHAFGLRFLKEHITKLSYKKNFSICDESNQFVIVKTALKSLSQNHSEYDIPTLISQLSQVKSKGDLNFSAYSDPLIEDLYQFYNERLKLNNLVDFDDLLLLPVQILKEHPELEVSVSNQYKYIMVDEYQDTNRIQDQLLRYLASYHKNICVVGDDDQSIYGWRGAEAANILAFDQRWKNCKTIKLEQNYRSTSTILNAANALIKNNAERKAKNLWSNLGTGAKLQFFLADSDQHEAEYLASQISNYLQKNQFNRYDIAVLYRRNTQARAIEEQLRFYSIPYRLVGGYKFYDRKEIKDALAYLRFISNPDDELALERILNVPNRKIGAATFEKLSRFSHLKEISVFQAMSQVFAISSISKDKQVIIYDFYEMIQRYLDLFKGPEIADTLKALLNEIDYKGFLKRSSRTEEEFAQKVDLVQEFIQSIYDYEDKIKHPSLEKFLDKILLLSQDEEDDQPQNLVTLMSLHASKGLEFPLVFMIGMEEGIFPSSRSMEENDDDVSEERRLAYVGVTRAKKQLHLSATKERKRYKEIVKTELSRFLIEIPSDLFDISPTEASNPEEKEKQSELAAEDFFSQMNRFRK